MKQSRILQVPNSYRTGRSSDLLGRPYLNTSIRVVSNRRHRDQKECRALTLWLGVGGASCLRFFLFWILFGGPATHGAANRSIFHQFLWPSISNQLERNSFWCPWYVILQFFLLHRTYSYSFSTVIFWYNVHIIIFCPMVESTPRLCPRFHSHRKKWLATEGAAAPPTDDWRNWCGQGLSSRPPVRVGMMGKKKGVFGLRG